MLKDLKGPTDKLRSAQLLRLDTKEYSGAPIISWVIELLFKYCKSLSYSSSSKQVVIQGNPVKWTSEETAFSRRFEVSLHPLCSL